MSANLEVSAESEYTVEVRAAVLRSPDTPIRTENIRLRKVGPSGVRVKIEMTGICHSDLSLARGVLAQPVPAVLGHEACGIVLETGAEVQDLDVGQRVMLLWNPACGKCFHCVENEPHLCLHASDRSRDPYAIDAVGAPVYPGLTVGSFAEQTVVPRNAVVAVPDSINMQSAALLGCAVTTGVGAVTKTAKVRAGSSVLVLGLGGIGLSAIQGARLRDARLIIAVDRNPEKEALALSVGAHHFLVADESLKTAVRNLTDYHGVDYAFDCVGLSTTIRDAWSLTRRGGSTYIIGIGGKDDNVSFGALELFYFARKIVGCVAGSFDANNDLPQFYEWVRSGALNLEPLISGYGYLDDVEKALDRMAAGEGIRTLILPSQAPSQ